MADDLAHSLFREPAVADPPPPGWRDRVLVGVLVPVSILEGIFRPDVAWRPLAIAFAITVVAMLPWRRRHSFAITTFAFGTVAVVTSAHLVNGGDGTFGLYTTAVILLLPYAQFRWGSGRHSAIVLAVMMVAATTGVAEDYTGVGNAIAGYVFLLFYPVLGAAVRHLRGSRQREIDEAKSREREQIARELHDTVAHHVSAILIQAQAGRTVAATRPGAATDALASIETEATRTLAEMRHIVGSLRDRLDHSEAAALAPLPGTRDLHRFSSNEPGGACVAVDVEGDLSVLPPPVDAAVYRLVQESITNARRHARHATRIDVRIEAHDDCVRLVVRDDGHTHAKRTAAVPGFGMIGMSERAALLGGTLRAGPDRRGGWTVVARLPLVGAHP